jgi:hypothetical protein
MKLRKAAPGGLIASRMSAFLIVHINRSINAKVQNAYRIMSANYVNDSVNNCVFDSVYMPVIDLIQYKKHER